MMSIAHRLFDPFGVASPVMLYSKVSHNTFKGSYNSKILAAVLGVRLAKSITNAFEWRSIKRYFWSDSTTVLTWITKDDNWIYPLEVDSSKDFSNPFTDLEEQRRGDNVPNPSDLRDISKGKLSLDQMKDIGVPNISRTYRHIKIAEKLNL
ncbi:hypothetical protein CDAR_439531 [Caerostris darwini]|uniref:Uncharacterized protein n=1 Tax=Caerostris darwini TaxID=1538125 RepID=A0AAV4MHV0_9ARAC|nr:hypothetical protein CDAR_439531 [Caerostris darwini]